MLKVLLLFVLLPKIAIAVDGTDIMLLHKHVQDLKTEIEQLDSEIKECEKNTKGWSVATGVGVVGTVATAVGATIQGVKLHNKKENTDNTGDKK
jgi:hypothetical protein